MSHVTLVSEGRYEIIASLYKGGVRLRGGYWDPPQQDWGHMTIRRPADEAVIRWINSHGFAIVHNSRRFGRGWVQWDLTAHSPESAVLVASHLPALREMEAEELAEIAAWDAACRQRDGLPPRPEVE